jgi:hypothetical protein
MIVTASQHAALTTHLVVTVPAGDRPIRLTAPQAVYTAIAALVDPEEIRGSHATYAHLMPTRWSVWAVTSTHLAFVELEFDGEDYDAEEEGKRLNPESRGHREAPASSTVVSTWARPLATALKLNAAGIVRDHPTAGGGFRLYRVTVEFADGTTAPAEGGFSCPMQRADGDSERWDDFIAAIRRGSPYLTVELESWNRLG